MPSDTNRPRTRSARAAAGGCVALAAAGAILLSLGFIQRSAPLAAPLPAVEAAPPLISTTTTVERVSNGPSSAAPTPASTAGDAAQPSRTRTTRRPPTAPASHEGAVLVTSAPADTLSIPILDQQNIAVTVATENGQHTLEPPADVHEVGIWTPGAPLGATQGTTDIVGHVNYTGQGPGALHDIAALHPGDHLYTSDHQRRGTTWIVTAVQARSKTLGVDTTAFPGPTGVRQLILITCGGPFDQDGQSYLDNIYVRAQPAQGP